jgi:glycerophosphoryl diester phosphodiesterase
MPAEARLITSTDRPICIAHRGASGMEPENTLRAFDRALEQGATWLELDVHHVHDRLLVIHDDTVDRTTTGSGPLSDHTLDELRALDAGWGQKIPFLDEVLEMVEGRARLNIELKAPAALTPTLTLLQAAIATGRWQPDQFLLSAFDWEILLLARQLEPSIPLAPLGGKGAGSEILEMGERLNAEAVHVARWSARARFVGSAHARGLAVRIYPVNRQWEFDLMARLNVDGVFTDYPDRALSWGAQAPTVGIASA